jgi:hypothetical protein
MLRHGRMTMPNWHRTSVVVNANWRDALLAHRMDRDAERSDQAMNVLATLYVTTHMQDMLDEAARERVRRAAQSSRPSRIVSALSSLRLPIGRRAAIAA